MFSRITSKKALFDVLGRKVHLEVGVQILCVSCELNNLISTLEDYLCRTLPM